MVSRRAARDLLGKVAQEYERVFTALEPLAAVLSDAFTGTDILTRDDLDPLRDKVFHLLDENRGFVAGAGVITAPGLLADAHYCLAWWWTRPAGPPEALRVNLDPTAPDFFDYPSADWYRTPERTLARHVAGPYVDYACTTEYATTVSVPVHANGTFLGVAAADVLVSRLEQRVLPALRRLGHSLAMVNAAGRVIASASARYAPGHLVSLTEAEPVALSRHGGKPPAVDWALVDTSAQVT
jgi:hypothetical protein